MTWRLLPSRFLLNTKVSAPHEDRITALCFRNAEKSDSPTLVTASRDGHFKVWVLADDSDIYSEWLSRACPRPDRVISALHPFCRR